MQMISFRVLLVLGVLGALAAGCAHPACHDELTKHPTGRLKRAGRVCNGLKQGRWFETYTRGGYRWEGTYVNDTLDMHPPKDSSGIHITFLDGPLHAGQEAPMRIQVTDIHPSCLTVSVSKGTIAAPGDPDMYDYVVRPSGGGDLRVQVSWLDPRTGVMADLGERSFPVTE